MKQKITIFGADGRTGREVVAECLRRGFLVTAFVYREPDSGIFDELVRVVVGDVLEYEPVLQAVQGSTGVISALGHVSGGDQLMQTKGMQHVVRAMQESGVSRVISLTGTGVRVRGDQPSVIDRVLNWMVSLIDRERVIDGQKHATVLADSGLDWTVVRVLKLSSGEYRGGVYHLTKYGPAELMTSRKKVARIMVDLVSSQQFVHNLPVVS